MKGPRLFLCAALLALGAVIAASPGFGEGGPSETKQEFERIKREMKEKKKEIKRAQSREHSVLSALEKIDRDILAGSTEFANQRKRLEEAETAEREIETSSERLGRELAEMKRVYAMRLRALYRMSRSGTAVIDPSDGLDGVIKQVKYLRCIAERDRTIIRDYSNALMRMRMQRADLAQKKEEILRSRRAVEAQKTELEAKRRQKSAILTAVRQQKGLQEQTLRELEEASASLWAMIGTDERERRSAAARKPAAGPHEEGAPGPRGRLPWPAEGPLLTRFGMQRHPQFGTMVFRRGIEIEVREGETVRAVEDGQVAYADWYRGYGKLVILDHGGGLYTLYGNLSKLDLKKGQRVSRGQAIGLAGETGSLKGAKLYFEIRRKGEAEDPLLWLAKK
ncbi:MAG TPA: peptidoglycan DD-metalloendopeptidase family protein [Nitrospirota bacterium]|nr:peptidoglycan DD-metalloendopeptidase family protein [Nitrospirota bacterium]